MSELFNVSRHFNAKRCRLLTKTSTPLERRASETNGGILYWMSRDQRVQGNIIIK